MLKRINIIGAFDRYNYGDVLLPIILSNRLKEYNFDIKYVSLKSADLTYCGGVKTESLLNLQNRDNNNDIFLVVGGDVVGADIGTMYLHMCENKIKVFLFKCIRKIIGKNFFNKLCLKITKINSIYPWVIDKKLYGKKIKIIYNAVGATNALSIKNSDDKEKLLDVLKQCNYISVREDFSSKIISPIKSDIYPDSAISMSRYYPISELDKKTDTFLKEYIHSKKNKYVTIQINREYLKDKNINIICNELRKIIDFGYDIVLLPIGFAALHEDLYSLRKIYKLIDCENVRLFEKINIFEIMNIISNSYLFLGTSLHGNITAMSYGVRHFMLGKKMHKLIEFINLWDIDKQKKIYELDDLSDCIKNAKLITDSELIENKNILLKLSDKNFNNILNIIERE